MESKEVDHQLEDALLGSIIHNPDEYENAAKYIHTDEIFHQQRARRLWRILTGLHGSKETIDLISLTDSLTPSDNDKGVDAVYIVDCSAIGNGKCLDHLDTYSKRLYEKYLLRRIVGQTRDIEKQAIENNESVYDTIVSAHANLGELIALRPGEKFDIDKELIDAINSITNKETKLMKTGYKSIDKFSGGLTRGEITIIGGRPGHGKTTFLINLLSQMIHAGLKVIFFNRELPNSEMIKKLITLESGKLSYSMVRKGVYEESEIEELQKAKQKIAGLYTEDKFLMFDNIRDFSRSATEISKFKPDVVMDDYIQLVQPSGHFDSRRLQIEQLVNDYKWLAKEHQCSVVLASQLNRSVEYRDDGEPRLSDLAESGAIEQVAENVFFVYYEHKVNAKKDKNIIRLKASKVRYGESGSADLGYDGDKVKIYNSFEEYESPEVKVYEENELPF
jgi:replicative DNA helicase